MKCEAESYTPDTLGIVEPSWTERRVLDLLATRYAVDAGNGPRYVFAEHVRSHTGFDARRTADAMALALWRSDGHELHGFEVKVTRSDWLRETRDPAKAEEFMAVCDRWWLVAPTGVAATFELPPGWGFLHATSTGLAVAKAAPRLRNDGRTIASREFLACFARAAARTAARVAEPEEQLALI